MLTFNRAAGNRARPGGTDEAVAEQLDYFRMFGGGGGRGGRVTVY